MGLSRELWYFKGKNGKQSDIGIKVLNSLKRKFDEVS